MYLMYKFTPEQKAGMMMMLTWMEEVALYFPNKQFICHGVLHTNPQRLVTWLGVHLHNEGYSDETQTVLNALREFYQRNKDRGMNEMGFVWEIPSPTMRMPSSSSVSW